MEKEKVTAKEVRTCLADMADPAYREFHSGLVPGAENILGVRMPKLRTLAKKLSKGDWLEWFHSAEDASYEEMMLRGLVLAYAKLDTEDKLAYIREFVPCINNWAVCDCFCNTLKDAEKEPDRYWEFLEPYFTSDKEYEARFGAVMLLSHFVREEYLYDALKRLEQIHQEDYYAKMAVAWAISVYFAAFPEEVLKYLKEDPKLDDFTYKKTLQKILESFRVDKNMKSVIREMKQRG